jgi:ribose transport system substrate-binding protein
MGELGVKTLIDHLQGRPIQKRVDTGVTLITPANLESPESQQLLHPPLERYLR